MTRLREAPGGRLVVEALRYGLELSADGMLATLRSPDGEHLAQLRLLAAFDAIDAPDETLSVEPPRVLPGPGVTVEVGRRSTRWERAGVRLTCGDEDLELAAFVHGRGRLAEVHLLGGRSLQPRGPGGFLPSGSTFRTLFSPNPGDPARLLRSAGESAVIGVAADSQPGRGHWFFTPAPLSLALTTAAGLTDPTELVADGWTGIALEAPVDELTFVQAVYQPADSAFSLRLDYDGHTEVDGDFTAPLVVVAPGVSDPYAGLRRHRASLVRRGAAVAPAARHVPSWWSAPIFCGWGAQCHLARELGVPASELSTQERYDSFLGTLEGHGVVPGTVVVDDKWQEAYGTCVPDERKWPNLRGWIAGRHEAGQRVLLWWKAWDAEGLDPELCIRNPDGDPVALDPALPAAREALADAVAAMLSEDGLDADGLKVDFTASTPWGRGLTDSREGRWGVALLHDLLSVVYAAAKRARPDALVVTHTPHPGFVDVTDMVRLNDMLRLDDPGPRPAVVPQMRYRAAVVRAACPELLVETDDWCAPDRSSWREFLEVKTELGVPSLYYTTHLDLTGEPLEEEDYAALRRTWAAWASTREEAAA